MANAQKINVLALSTNLSPPKWSIKGKSEGKTKGQVCPGPGKYGVPDISCKYKRTPTVGFGSGQRMTEKKYAGLGPGPGSYTAFDPNDPGFAPGAISGPAFGFGTAARIPVRKMSTTPEPGQYAVSKKLCSDRAFSFGGRQEGKKSASGPGPGQYAGHAMERAWAATSKSDGNVSMGSAERIKELKPDKGPGPGQYYRPGVSFDNTGTGTKSAPNFSLYSRRPPAKGDATPGPNTPHYSQF
eukprot:TRINITY_DN13138_c0_g1_i1.p1 TRINITY_DN13138_c0_g1~~TRINITY_DN13138_c0_g1_i1.p1  ORF type:complete len:241 (+),score=49.63 TRINITY_DN13138_c0_g1_i1:127-849(+)